MTSSEPKAIQLVTVAIGPKDNVVELEPAPVPILKHRDASPKRSSSPSPQHKRTIRSSRRDPIPGGENATLPRWQVLTISSADFEKFAAEFKNTNPQMTIAETKELQRQRRLVRNRESAAESRNKRKMYLQQLEGTTKNVDQEKLKLIDDAASLRVENNALRDRNVQLERDLQLYIQNNQALQAEITRLKHIMETRP